MQPCVQKPAYVIALDTPVAAGEVIAAAFVRSALSASLVDRERATGDARDADAGVFGGPCRAWIAAVCQDANGVKGVVLNAASTIALSPCGVNAPMIRSSPGLSSPNRRPIGVRPAPDRLAIGVGPTEFGNGGGHGCL